MYIRKNFLNCATKFLKVRHCEINSDTQWRQQVSGPASEMLWPKVISSLQFWQQLLIGNSKNINQGHRTLLLFSSVKMLSSMLFCQKNSLEHSMNFHGDYIKRCLLARGVSQILYLTKLISEIKYISANGLFTTLVYNGIRPLRFLAYCARWRWQS